MLAIRKLSFGVQTHRKTLGLHNSWGDLLDRIGATTPESVQLELPIPGTPIAAGLATHPSHFRCSS